MNKFLTVSLAALLLIGCYCQCRKNTPVLETPVEQEVVAAAPVAQPAEEVKTAEVTSTLPATVAKNTTAQPVAAKQTTLAKSTPVAVAATVAQPVQAVEEKTEVPQAPQTPQVPQFTPFPFKPTFKNEPVISTEGRMLNPYAALVPDATAKQTAPWAYEQLKYGVYYSFVKAGTAYIHNLGLVNIEGRPAYVFQTTAFSASVIDAVFRVRDINQSWMDAQEFYSYGYGQSVREGNYVRDEWLKFNYPAKKYEGLIRKKEEPSEISGPLDIKVVDMLTSLYYVRGHDLQVGTDVVFDIINREKQYPLVVKVLKKERVKVAAGKFDCIVVEPQMRGEGIFVAKGKSLKVWLTDDQYRMPVKMAVEVFIGSVSAELLEYQRQAPANIL
ncbi:MAG: DUF3108 domain-containing protein [Elusimicrobiaceae bacterium]|nr:DUF3108 domain-containing protein [Elusimicrobiaceae bacterium]